MALTRQLGALGSNQQKANQVIANIVGRQLAASRNTGWSAPAPRNDAWAAPLPRFQAPVFRQVQQQAAGAIPRMSAAQQIISQAAKQRNAQQRTNVLQQIGQRALANALTVAGNQSGAATFQPRDVAVVPRNRYAAQINAAFTPEQEGQLFDQQIQYTKAMADPYEWMDPSYSKRMDTIAGQIEQVRSGFANPTPISPRIQQEQQALAAFPQMTPQEVRGRSDSQLAALLDVSRQPTPAGSGAGTPDRVGGVDTSPNEMTRSGPPKGPPPQPGYNPLPSYDVTKGPPPQPAYNPLPSYDVTAPRSGAQQVADAMTGALPRVRGGNAGVTQGGQMADDDGGGGLLGGILDAAGEVVTGSSTFIRDVGQALVDSLRGTPAENIVGDFRDAASGTYESFLNSEAGSKLAWLMEKMDWARQQSVEALGEQAYGAASGKSWEEAQQGRVGSLGSVGAALNLSPDDVIWMAILEVAPELREPVIDAYENGYTSPAHIARLEAAGVDPATAPPQFTGGRAVWEMLIGLTDELPPAARYPIRMLSDILLDPLTYVPIAGAGGKGLRGYGAAMRAAEEASPGGRVIGGLLEGTGAIVEIGARAPDAPVELLVAGGKKAGSVFGEVTGLLSESARTGRIAGAETAAQLDDVLQATINDAPSRGARTAFDAEAQGNIPTSGPQAIITPTTGQAAPTHTVEGNRGTYQSFDTLPDSPNATPGAPAKIYDFHGTQIEIRPFVAADGRRLWSATSELNGVTSGISKSSYTEIMDDIPLAWGGSPQTVLRGTVSHTDLSGVQHAGTPMHTVEGNRGIYPAFTTLPDSQNMAPGPPGSHTKIYDFHGTQIEIRSFVSADGRGLWSAVGDLNGSRTGIAKTSYAALMDDIPLVWSGSPQTVPRGTVSHTDLSGVQHGAMSGAAVGTAAQRQAAAAANTVPGAPRNTGAAGLAQAAGATNGRTRFPRNTGNANVDKSLVRARRLAKEKRDGLPREVNKILAPQKKGEHEFSPIYGGHRPLDRIVTDAIDSRDAGKLARAEAFIKRVDDTVERELRTDAFYQTWARGGAPVYLRDDPRFTDDVFETMRLFEPDASPARLETLANGIAKGTMDDIALVQFQINQLLPMILREFPDQITSVDGLLGSIARIPGGNFRDESAAWLMREYMDTPLDGVADTILTRFLTGATERPIIADGVHMPYAHSIPSAYHAESIARLTQMRDQWTKIKRKAALQANDTEGWRNQPSTAPTRPRSALGFAQADPIASALLDDAGRLRLRTKWQQWFSRGVGEEQPRFGPEVAPDHTRLYRVEYAGPDKRPDHIRYQHIATGQEAARGRWFVADPGLSQFYIEDIGKFGEIPIRIRYTDIPTAELDSWRVRNAAADPPIAHVKPIDPKRYSLDPDNEFWLTRTMADNAKILPNNEQRRFTEYAGVRSDWFDEVAAGAPRSSGSKLRGAMGAVATADPITDAISDAIVARRLRRSGGVTPGTAVDEVSNAPFREADQAAQFAGSARGAGRSLGDQMKAAAEKAKRHMATPEEVEAAIGSVRDPYLRAVLLSGNGKLTVELAEFGDRLLPSTWKPPGIREFPVAGSPKTEWNVREALEYLQEYKANHPDFDYLAARNELGASAMGLPPKLTAAQVKEMKKAARAAGLSDAEVAAIKDGATKMERLAATKAVRLFDAAMTALRSTLMFNPISGTPGRIGDVIGNSMAHLVAGKDPWGALRQIPMSFTATKKYRKLARDPGELTKAWSASTPHMAETGMVYSPSTFHGSVKLSEEDIAKLPWLNEKVKGTPVAVRTAASVWTTPYLKDITVAGELAGRKIAVDRVYLATIRRESLPAFRDYLEKRFPGQSKQLLSDIASSAQDKAGRSWGGNFSHGDVLHAVDTDAARAWQRELNRAMAKADAEAGHLFFSAKMTNADEIARRTFTFHYWMVRASWMYFRTVMQNPGMLSGFTRMYQEAQQISEEQGLPKWLSGMFKFFQGNGGMYAAMNPIGILFPLVAMDVYSQEGNKFQALQNMLSPVWSGVLGGLGATQNIPNAFGTRSQERFVIDMLNFLKGEGVDLEGIPGIGQFFDNDSLTLRVPSEEFVKWVIGKANSALGQPMGAYEPFDRAANEHDQLFSIGQQIGMTLWGDDITKWTDVQVAELDAAVEQAITGVGEDTWLSETIRATYGQEGAVRAVGSLAIPGGIVTRQGFRDEQMALSQAYWDNYKDGVEPTPEQKSAAAGRQMATSAKPVWLAINTAYHAIGTPDQQRKYGIYNDVLYGPESLNPKTTIVVPNGDGTYTFFTMAELAAMEYEDRVKVVDAWAAVTDDMADAHRVVKEGRDAFKAAHPEYGQYTEYQKGVFGYEGGISQFRKEMRDNPTFKAAEDAERKQLQKEGITGSQLEAELDNWATGQEAFFAAIGEPWKLGDEVKGTPGPSSVIAMQNLRDKDEPKSGSRGGAEKPKDPNVDEFWSPEQGVPRLASDQAQWEYDNNEMERRFGAAWNADLGEWEDDYDSAKERDEAGIGDKTYVLPSTTESMRRYEAWAEEHPGGTPEEFFEQMLKTEGFGKRPKVPGTAAIQLPAGGTIYRPGTKATGPSRSAQSATSTGGRVLVTNAPNVGSRPGEDPDALRVVEVANSYVGQVPYVWGAIPGKGQDPSGGWDCSGMTYWLDQNYGSGQLPMGSHYQYAYAQDTGKLFTDLANLQPGDIVFIDTGWQGGAGGNLNPAGHVGIYAGNGKLINAANSAQGTVIVPLNSYGNILGAMHGSW